MTKIIDGRKIQKNILEKVKDEIALLPFQPVFCDILVGDDPASIQYVNIKARVAESVGIKFHRATFPSSITTNDLIKEIEILNKIENMCGIIVQLPLPVSIDKQKVLDAIDPRLDVDCIGATASNKFYSGDDLDLGFPTALACMNIIDSLDIDLKDKKIVVLGQGQLVGRPVVTLLKSRGFIAVAVDNFTKDKEKIIKEADVIISGIGKGKYITGDMIKKDSILIDAGTSESLEYSPTGQLSSSIIGDIDLESVWGVASYVSPVPGGVGPVTVAILLGNVLQVAKSKI